RGQSADESRTEHDRWDRQRLAFRGGEGFREADLGASVRLAVLDQLVNELADRPFRRRRSGINRLQHQASSPSLWLAVTPVLSSRATTKPTTAAPASAMPGLLRTKLRVSSISSSGSLDAIWLATFSIDPAARRAYSPYSGPSRSSMPAAVSPIIFDTLASASDERSSPCVTKPRAR